MKEKAPYNRTLECDDSELIRLSEELVTLHDPAMLTDLEDAIICQNFFDAVRYLPQNFVDLLILDPPYNLSKNYNGYLFRKKERDDYQEWFSRIISVLKPTLTASATVYACADWRTSLLIAPVLESHFHIRNRITWEREKGRGAAANWKNNTEDIWFCTASDNYCFNVEAVKLKRKVYAPYRINGTPKDWKSEPAGDYRLTHPSNIWTDTTVPFWSMPENTPHPTQKPEKLMAKLILASSRAGDFVLDPFLGSGTTAAVARKLGRRFCGIEIDQEYCCWALKRLENAAANPTIQGYADGVFWDRNTLSEQMKAPKNLPTQQQGLAL